MINKTYTTKELISQYLGEEEISGNIDIFIISAQSYIDRYCGRDFRPTEAGVARLYASQGGNRLVIDPALAIAKVEITSDNGASYSEITDYVKKPFNSLPIVEITSLSNYFPVGLISARVTGQFGWEDGIPQDISYVATVIASKMYKGNSINDISSESIGDYSVGYKSETTEEITFKNILDKYKQLF